ncbi:MAG: integrase family protein [Alphaproteobacteria bacterium]|nr:integrase family protein [Alphaproteobacteria bacterium]
MSKKNLSDKMVKHLPLPENGQARYWDASLSGFGLRVSQGGAKTWIVLDPRANVRTPETIGRYPIISLADARAEAKRRLAENTLGKHTPRSITWKNATDEYLQQIEKTRKARTHADYKRLLGLFNFASTRLSDLTPHQIQKRLERLKDTPTEHLHAFAAARQFFNWAHAKYYVDQSPMMRMKPPIPRKSRERILTDNELKAVWNACGADTYGTIVKLLILTGQRKGEITHLSGDMIEGDSITFPSSLTKNSRAHTIPLLALTASTLASHEAHGLLPKANEPLLGVCVGNSIKSFSAFSKNKKKLDEASAVYDWTLHDLRRTFASGLAGQGVSIHVVEKLLNHISGSFAGIVGVYQRHNFMPEMQDAIGKWERHLRNLVYD